MRILRCVAVIFLWNLILHTACNEVNYKLISDRKQWADADKDCRSRDGTLVVLDTHDRVMAIQAAGVLETGRPVWTTAYRQHSPWVWVEGCFSAPFLTKTDGTRLAGNQAAECSAACRDFNYAAVKGHMCFCLEDMRELQPLDARECGVRCPGSAGEWCGGDRGAVSVYSLGGVNGYKESERKEDDVELQQSVHEVSRSDWKNCVYILKHDTPVWISSDCRKARPFLCKIYREEGSVIEYKSPRRKTGSWLESRDLCRAEGGTLADLHVNNMEAVLALPDHSEFWVGLYRNTSWTWQTDPVLEFPQWCTAVTEDKLGELHFNTESCSIPHDYICQIPVPVATQKHSPMVAYLVTGSVVWVLAIATGVFVFYMVRRKGCCKRSSGGQTRTSYLDLDESAMTSRNARTRPPRPLSHSYVNSDVSNAPSCSQQRFDSSDPPLKSKGGSEQEDQSYRSTGNEYASVCMSKIAQRDNDFSPMSDDDGACNSGYTNRGSTSTEGYE
ncbi:uncharacterized protein LOC128233586 [Mya arenaria]|uniref:uncharacterized protein LOC128233586 n=1 Tax=Mya arenaria TaxID=6604 RepID=UPI0022E197B4|nr:uncharacterized protein LOC128233586 [Mya arenaria]